MSFDNILPVELFIALRYLKARRRGLFSALTSFIAVGGTALGVAALLITLAVMSGFQNDIRDKILGIQPHIVVTKADGNSLNKYKDVEKRIETNKSIVHISPFIYVQGIARSATATTGIVVKAINFESENKILNLSKQIVETSNDFSRKNIGEKAIILGAELAKTLGVSADDNVILMFPSGNFSTVPKMHKFKVAAVFSSGMYDFDVTLGFMDLSEGQKLFSMEDQISGFDIRINNFEKALQISSRLQSALGFPYNVKAWTEMNKNLFSALRLEKIMMFLILTLIILVAAFNVVSNLLLLSVQKSKEIGIMSAMGFSKFSIAKIFFYEGIMVGFSGALIGIFFGLAISLSLKHLDIFELPKEVYYVSKLPIAIIPFDVFIIAASAFAICVAAALYPAYQVSKSEPLLAIRYG
ncbi:MAG: ABC transporter permease [Elusimicrobiota bacterium]|jgi:lipoprotein-releasing system permease protein|nr:ABC transporter permease [Elusimicrobiota bacterium]